VGAPAPLQEAVVTALRFPDSYYQQMREQSTRRRDVFLYYLDQLGLPFTRPEGAYYVLIDISACGFPDDRQFCDWLVKEAGIAAVPGSSFFQEPVRNLIRLNFAKREETLVEAARRLLRIKKLI